MPDIALRFHQDMLVLSSPIDASLARQGVDVEKDREFFNLVEPDTVRDLYHLEQVAGAQCLVTNTAGITQARLAHLNMEDRAFELATASLTIVNSLKPQHVLVEIGPTRLPLDISSASSLKQSRDQYAQAAQAFGTQGFDAFFVNEMSNPVDMQCALMGIRMTSDAPVFASLNIDKGNLFEKASALVDTFLMMEEYGATVIGFSTAKALDVVVALVEEVKRTIESPLLVQLFVGKDDSKQGEATKDNPYFSPDVMVEAATLLRGAGVQFLRAAGNATPAYTSALAVASSGFDVVAGA